MTNSYTIVSYGCSDVGLVRQNNEDFWDEVPNIKLYILADGMGGHKAGEVASREAVNALKYLITKFLNQGRSLNLSETKEVITQAFAQANQLVFQLGHSNDRWKGMGTTLCCLLFKEKSIIYGNVGDSRIYRLRNKKLEQLTVDDSLLSELMSLGTLKDLRESELLYKNILTKAIGTEPSVIPTVKISEVAPGDIYLMCSDGLSDMLSQDEMEQILNQVPNVTISGQNLILAAKEKGGYDNITVVLTQIKQNQTNNGAKESKKEMITNHIRFAV